MQIPENGFYYHYKHDDAKGFNDYAYEVVGLALHSEEKSYLVLYRPLYENDWLAPAQCSARPLELFFNEVTYNNRTLSHFWKITNPDVVAKLEEMKKKLY